MAAKKKRTKTVTVRPRVSRYPHRVTVHVSEQNFQLLTARLCPALPNIGEVLRDILDKEQAS